MKNIIFFARSLQTELYFIVGNSMKGHGYNPIYLVQRNDEETQLLKLGCEEKIINIQKYLSDNWINYDVLNKIELSKIEKDYDIDSLWELIYTDRFLINYNYEEVVIIVKLIISLYLEIFRCYKPIAWVNEELSMFSPYIFYKMGVKHSCKYIGFSNPRHLFNERFAIINNDDNLYPAIDKEYKRNKFTGIELREAREYLTSFREKHQRPSYLKNGHFSEKKPTFKVMFVGDIVKYFVAKLIWNKIADYTKYKNVSIHLERIRNYFNYLRQKKYYEYPIENEKYYFFPLHYQPEASTLVFANKYEKQSFALDLIAKKIPIDAMLYVKEHFTLVGHRDMDFYRRLKSYPNVRLINPWHDSHKLIKNSAGVITLTGTAGWESILYGIPTFILGKVFYQSFKYAYTVERIDELPLHIKNSKAKNNSEDYDYELTRYLAAYLKGTKKGSCYLLDPNIKAPNNIQSLKNAIIHEIEKDKVVKNV